MSTQSTKADGRSTKAPRRTIKKAAKSARASDKKPSKSARRGTAAITRPTRAAALSAPSAASKPISKTASKAVTKTVAKTVAKTASANALKMIRTASPPVQPMATHEISSLAHKYHVGEIVYFTSPTFGRAAASGSYTVVKLLPSEGDDYQYRIKSSGEAFERVAKESQLDRI